LECTLACASLTPLESTGTLAYLLHAGDNILLVELSNRAAQRPEKAQALVGSFAIAAVAWLFVSGCSASHKTSVKPSQAPAALQTATKTVLIGKYNSQADSIHSVNTTVKMKLTGGSNYSGVIEQYHQVNGFMLAARPANIRVIGQAPVVGKNIFDMVSNGEEFHVFIPSKNDFIVGPTNLQRPSKKPVENLRPQHLVDALLWAPISDRVPVLFEQANEPQSRYYVLTVLRRASKTETDDSTLKEAPGELEVARKIWFNRADLNVSRIETYAPAGVLTSDDSYSVWDTFGNLKYPRQIDVRRPGDDYQLQITVVKATFNEPISADRFILPQPPGTELIRVGEESREAQP
jgi:outer membrane lipoprotein-sorting protein